MLRPTTSVGDKCCNVAYIELAELCLKIISLLFKKKSNIYWYRIIVQPYITYVFF